MQRSIFLVVAPAHPVVRGCGRVGFLGWGGRRKEEGGSIQGEQMTDPGVEGSEVIEVLAVQLYSYKLKIN